MPLAPSDILLLIGSFVFALFVSGYATWRVRNWALAQGWATPPSSDRHVHRDPIPRLGGIAIFLTFVITVTIFGVAALFLTRWADSENARVLLILIPGTMLFLIGLYDDFNTASAKFKLAAQMIAGALLYLLGFRVMGIGINEASVGQTVIGLSATVIWVIWISNAFNLIDGLDGLAAGSALFSTITVFIVSLFNGNIAVAMLTAILAGAILGFLRFNFNPATIFLGDCGSLFVGFTLSALALAGTQQSKAPTLVAVAIPVIAFGLPLMDTVLSVLRRYLGGRPLFDPDREHIHHKLLDRGLSHRQVVVVLYAVSALCAMLSLFLLHPTSATVGIVLLVLACVIFLGVQQLGYHEFFELGRMAQRTLEGKKAIVNNLAIRRAADALSEASSFPEIVKVLEQAFAENGFDGFHLELFPANPTEVYGHTGREQAFEHVWSKSDVPAITDPLWQLTLELAHGKSLSCGRLNLYCSSADNKILMDVNLLVSEFQPALSHACRLALVREDFETVAAKHFVMTAKAGKGNGNGSAHLTQ